jgi:hypothetical protein
LQCEEPELRAWYVKEVLVEYGLFGTAYFPEEAEAWRLHMEQELERARMAEHSFDSAHEADDSGYCSDRECYGLLDSGYQLERLLSVFMLS